MKDILQIYINELRCCTRDLGVMVFFILVPLFYPLLYTYIYSQEVVRDVSVAACDLSNSMESRRFIRNTDATPEVEITHHCTDMLSARLLMEKEKVKGIIFIPQNFSNKINSGEQAHISIYCSMASLFYYKAMLVACTEVSLAENSDIMIKKLVGTTRREADVTTLPLRHESINISNPTVGFANFVIPAILVLIIQQTLLLGIGMRMGTEYEKHLFNYNTSKYKTIAILTGRTLAYITIYIPIMAYILCMVPYIFSLSQLAQPATLIIFMLPYILASTFLAITLGSFIKERETPMLLFVFTSVPFLFLSGISWPGSSIPIFLKIISYILPSTPGINGFVSINEMGSSLAEVQFEYHILWLQAVIYGCTAYFAIQHKKNSNLKIKI